MTKKKLLVIGLDGATFDLMEPWLAEGSLPNFAKLMQAGSHGRLRSVPNTDTAPAWATFATGLNPANHGIFHEFNWSADRTTLEKVNNALGNNLPFWQLASDADKRVVVMNVPFSHPATAVNGLMLAGYGAPGEHVEGFSYPADLIHEIDREVGQYKIDSAIQIAILEDELEKGLEDSLEVAQRRTDAFIYGLRKTDWELATIAYNLPDVMAHFFWQQMVTGHGSQTTAIKEGYMYVDQQIGRLLDEVGDETNILVMSDHGFGPLCATPQLLSEWLMKQGFTRKISAEKIPLKQRLTRGFHTILRHYVNERLKERLRHMLPGMRNRVESGSRFAGIDWSSTVAFAGPSPYEVWINRAGREKQGVVTDANYNEICAAVTQALLDWTDPETGKARVKRVMRADEVYHGRFKELAPDLTIEWNVDAAPAAETMPGNSARFDADHQPFGVLILCGPDIAVDQPINNPTLEDIAPTILHLLQAKHATKMDGRILAEVLK